MRSSNAFRMNYWSPWFAGPGVRSHRAPRDRGVPLLNTRAPEDAVQRSVGVRRCSLVVEEHRERRCGAGGVHDPIRIRPDPKHARLRHTVVEEPGISVYCGRRHVRPLGVAQAVGPRIRALSSPSTGPKMERSSLTPSASRDRCRCRRGSHPSATIGRRTPGPSPPPGRTARPRGILPHPAHRTGTG